MSDSYRLRFVGRFVFACQGDSANATKVSALGLDMAYNADLGSGRHRLFLTAQRAALQTVGMQQADLTLFGISSKAVAEDQLLIWDVEGCELSVQNAESGTITLVDFSTLPDIEKLSSPASGFDQRWLRSLPARSPVAFRLSFEAGTFTAAQFQPRKRAAFKPLDAEPDPAQIMEQWVPDVVDAQIRADGPLVLSLMRRDTAAEGSIVVMPADAPSLAAPVLTFSNLCTRAGSDEDREFAAYYDLLTTPPHTLKRQVPYTIEGREMGSRTDCSGKAAVYY